MERKCDNCYWKDYKNKFCINKESRPCENICNRHSFICEGSNGDYKYKGKHYCGECILSIFDVEESTTTHYYHNGEYLGDSDDFNEVISNLDRDIESI